MSTCIDADRFATTVWFRAMSTDVGITIVGGDTSLPDWAHGRVDRLEQLWSRFRVDSEISVLNRADGEAVEVSAETVGAVRAACAAWSFTGGRFDPTVHDSLLRLGYDDSIDDVRRRQGSASAQAPVPAPGCAGIEYDETASVVRLPAGVRLDLGGIGKGLAADDVATGLMARGATGAMVNIGGDVRVVGTPSIAAMWRVEIEDPRTEQICATVHLLDGGVATSTTLRRRWRLGSTTVHHLIDPVGGGNPVQPSATGAGAGAGIIGVAVLAGTAGWADALSKVPFVAHGVPGAMFDVASTLIICDDGSIQSHGPHEFVAAMHA